MLVSIHYVRDGAVRLSSIKKSMERVTAQLKKKNETIGEDEFKAFRTNFRGIALDMMNGLTEIEFTFDRHTLYIDSFISVKSKIAELLANGKEATDLSFYIEGIEYIENQLKNIDYKDYSTYDIKRDIRSYEGHHNQMKTDDFYLQSIGNIFKLHGERTIRVIDPSPVTYASIAPFKALMPEGVRTYASGVPERSASQYKEQFDKVALGTSKGSTVSNEVFDVMFLQASVTHQKQSEKLLVKKEKDLVRDTAKYLRTGGYLFLILPHFKFYKDMCLLLAKNYTDFQVRTTQGDFFNKTGSIFLVAKRKDKKDKEADSKEYSMLRRLYDIKNTTNIIQKGFEEVTLPSSPTEVSFFRGSVLDTDELKDILTSSGSMAQFWKQQKVEKMSENPQNPLLPFNTGQLGLVLTSGVLDGIVEEGRGFSHVVKGRVVKKTDSERDYTTNNVGTVEEVELTETTSNRVEINVLLPDGTHKILA